MIPPYFTQSGKEIAPTEPNEKPAIGRLRLVAETIGGVSPVGWLQPATAVIDEALNDYEVIWAAAGHPHAVFPTTFVELKKISNAKPMIVRE